MTGKPPLHVLVVRNMTCQGLPAAAGGPGRHLRARVRGAGPRREVLAGAHLPGHRHGPAGRAARRQVLHRLLDRGAPCLGLYQSQALGLLLQYPVCQHAAELGPAPTFQVKAMDWPGKPLIAKPALAAGPVA